MKIGLVLGGGGARGAAHVGVLMELQRLGVVPDLITGTSIGGMIGALYAARLPISKIETFISALELGQMYHLPGNAPALTGSGKIEKLLLETLDGHPTFADLSIPLALVTTDLVSRRSVILDEGDLITAVLATTAIPILLPPVERDGMVLVDGGLLNNVPFDIARARGATYVIAVDLTRTAPYGTPTEPAPAAGGVLGRVLALTQRRRTWQILSTVMDIITVQSFNGRMVVSQPNLLIRPELGTISLFDFHRWQEGIRVGIAAVQPHLSELESLANHDNDR